MMNSFMIFIMMLSTLILMFSKNPMKASFSILMTSSIMFLILKIKTGMAWMPMIFFMLFTGGILMVFMILASILPNEKVSKIKISKATMILFLMLIMVPKSEMIQSTELAPQMKSFMSSSLSMAFMISMILIYFFGSVNLNTESETSMRSIM